MFAANSCSFSSLRRKRKKISRFWADIVTRVQKKKKKQNKVGRGADGDSGPSPPTLDPPLVLCRVSHTLYLLFVNNRSCYNANQWWYINNEWFNSKWEKWRTGSNSYAFLLCTMSASPVYRNPPTHPPYQLGAPLTITSSVECHTENSLGYSINLEKNDLQRSLPTSTKWSNICILKKKMIYSVLYLQSDRISAFGEH